MSLPYSYYRCVGITHIRPGDHGMTVQVHAVQCVGCRRREPGALERQQYLNPDHSEAGCMHRIAPKE